MKPWKERPHEEASLLNPAFCSLVACEACAHAELVNKTGIPFSLMFMLLPIALHKATRDALPTSAKTTLPTWLIDNPEARINFAERVIALKPHTREALIYGLTAGHMSMQSEFLSRTAEGKRIGAQALKIFEGETRECYLASRLIGKWFASIGSTETTMALWGIQP